MEAQLQQSLLPLSSGMLCSLVEFYRVKMLNGD